jgi:hypothetical protein
MSFQDQLRAVWPESKRVKQVRSTDHNSDILQRWLIESLAKPPARIHRTRPVDQRAISVKKIGDDYWVASISSNLTVSRGMSQDREVAVNRCRQMSGGRGRN